MPRRPESPWWEGSPRERAASARPSGPRRARRGRAEVRRRAAARGPRPRGPGSPGRAHPRRAHARVSGGPRRPRAANRARIPRRAAPRRGGRPRGRSTPAELPTEAAGPPPSGRPTNEPGNARSGEVPARNRAPSPRELRREDLGSPVAVERAQGGDDVLGGVAGQAPVQSLEDRGPERRDVPARGGPAREPHRGGRDGERGRHGTPRGDRRRKGRGLRGLAGTRSEIREVLRGEPEPVEPQEIRGAPRAARETPVFRPRRAARAERAPTPRA